MIVEELIGKLSLQTKGIKDARDAVKVLADFRKALKGLAEKGRANFDGPAKMAKAFREAQAAQRKFAAGGDMAKGSAGLKKQVSLAEKLRSVYVDVAKVQTNINRGPGRGRSWILGEIDNLRRYSRDLKNVEREAARRGVPRHRARKLAQVPYGERHPIGEAIGGGVLGAGVARGSKYAVMQGANQLQETNRQFNAGMEADQISRLDKAAVELSAQYPSVDANTIRGMGRDARNMMPNFDKGMEILPDLVKARVMLQAAKGVEAADNELQDFLKAADIVGKTESVDSVRKLLNGAVKAVAVEGNQLPLREYKNAAKMSKAAGTNISEDFWTSIFPTFAQSEGGARFGTQIAAGSASLVSGRRTKKSTAALAKYGLLDKAGKTKGIDLLQTNPYDWALQYLMPALAKKKIDINDDKKVAAAIADIFSSSMSENEFAKLITQREQVERNKRTYAGAKGLEAAKDQTRGDPYVGFEGLVAQIRNFLGVTQSENVAGATKGLATITEAIGSFTKSLSENPETAQKVGIGTAAAAAGAGGFGIFKFLQGARRVLGLGGDKVKVGGAAEAAAEGVKAGPQASAMDTAARGIARGAAAAAFPITAGLTKGDQTRMIERAVRVIQQQQEAKAEVERETRRGRAMTELGRPRAAAIPTLPGGPSGALPRMLQNPNGQFGAVAERLAEIQTSAQKVMTTLDHSVQLKVDASQIDAAQAKADKLKATMGSIGGVSGGGLGSLAVGLHKSGNSFTSPSATAP